MAGRIARASLLSRMFSGLWRFLRGSLRGGLYPVLFAAVFASLGIGAFTVYAQRCFAENVQQASEAVSAEFSRKRQSEQRRNEIFETAAAGVALAGGSGRIFPGRAELKFTGPKDLAVPGRVKLTPVKMQRRLLKEGIWQTRIVKVEEPKSAEGR